MFVMWADENRVLTALSKHRRGWTGWEELERDPSSCPTATGGKVKLGGVNRSDGRWKMSARSLSRQENTGNPKRVEFTR